MNVNYSGAIGNLDQPAYQAQAERPDRPVRVRIQPTLLRSPVGAKDGNHRAWPGVSWTLECRNAEEAIQVRDALAAFFAAVARFGAPAVAQALTASTQVK